MKILITAVLLIAPQVLAAQTVVNAPAPVIVVAPPAKVVTVDCDSGKWPDRQAVKQYLDAHSRDEVQQAWSGMRRELAALCARGQTGARVAFHPAAVDGRALVYIGTD